MRYAEPETVEEGVSLLAATVWLNRRLRPVADFSRPGFLAKLR